MIASDMPGHAGSPYWAAVDFDSEGEDVPTPPPSHRVYLDPWDSEANAISPPERAESSQEENFNSFAGEPVSASFYYVPTKNYDSGEEPPLPPPRRKITLREDIIPDDYSIYGRKLSRTMVPDIHEHSIYGERLMTGDRRRSTYIEEPFYVPHPMAPMMYEPIYGGLPPPPPGYIIPPRPRKRVSLPNQPEYVMSGYGKRRHSSRLADAYEHFSYENQLPEYEDWARPFPKTAPDNFHLSRYGHLQIDYSLSWHSLDRLIRNQ